jgi:hypothetical protein
VLSSYFDLEHIAYVHPSTFGEARVIAAHSNTVVWELVSPRYLGVSLRHSIVQEYVPPDGVRARVTKGILRGTEVTARFQATDLGTLVEEVYELPVPELPLVGPLLRRWLIRKADEIWEEDLKVDLPHGGWPGLPPFQLGAEACGGGTLLA